MKQQLITVLVSTLMVGCVNANPVSWKERGSTVSASVAVNEETASSDKSLKSKAPDTTVLPTVKLPTGQEAVLTGGVYVNSSDVDSVLAWASQNGYSAKKDKYRASVVHIDVSPEKSVEVASQLSALPGVETSSPNYKVPKVLK